MLKHWQIVLVSSLIFVIAVLLLALLLVKLLWAWTIPDLFPGAVEKGLIRGRITWWMSFKIALFISVLSGVAGIRHSATEQKSLSVDLDEDCQ